jgi:hypothetical protein
MGETSVRATSANVTTTTVAKARNARASSHTAIPTGGAALCKGTMWGPRIAVGTTTAAASASVLTVPYVPV